ncbi:MAG: CCA tRNA nucleotidyltransferase [Proteobacteria bacterium]|nr:CCA tRNA nucleotidyltransferase [Pseudomonadota bacterium]
METRLRIPTQSWMTAPEIRAVVSALTEGGSEARFVGGCVRDAVLGRLAKDIDLATHLPPEAVVERVERAGLHAVPTGIQHGTVTVVCGRAHFEVTTLRLDVETFGRHARVAFTNDWAEDAARRDFTINALFCSPPRSGDGECVVHDYFGGVADLKAGRVRFVGDPVRRIREDRLRLLRFFRFYAHYGRPPPDAPALKAARALAHELPLLSGERIGSEILRLLEAPSPAPVMRLMARQGVLAFVLPEAKDFARLAALVEIEREEGAAEGPGGVRRLGAVLATDATGAEAVAERLRLSNRQRDALVAVVAPAVAVATAMEPRALHSTIHRLGNETVREVALVAWAGERAVASAEEAAWRRLLVAAKTWTAPLFPLKGRDALALGVPPGPRVGELLEAVEAWWVDGDFVADRRACLERLRALLAAPGG